MRHPQVDDLYLYRHRLNAPYPGGQHVLMYRAEPGSDFARALEELRSLSAAPTSASLGGWCFSRGGARLIGAVRVG